MGAPAEREAGDHSGTGGQDGGNATEPGDAGARAPESSRVSLTARAPRKRLGRRRGAAAGRTRCGVRGRRATAREKPGAQRPCRRSY
jgi:hypothetical protein